MFKNLASQKLTVFAFDSTTNLPKTGDAANITAYYDLDDAGVTVLTDTSATEKDATNAKGYYIFDLAQAETNGNKILYSAKSATSNIVVIAVPAVVFTLPNTGILAPATAGRTLVVDASGLADANTVKLGPTGAGTAQTARDIGLSVLISSGSGTGQLDVTSGVIKANLAQILGTALTETAGLLAGGFKKFFNVATPTGTVNSLPDAVAGAASGIAIVGSNMGTITGGTITTYTGNTPQTGDSFARLGVAGAGLTALGDTRIANLDTTVSSRTKPADTQARVTLVDTVTTLTGNTAQTGDAFARIGAPVGVSISADIAEIEAETDSIGAAGAGLTAIPTIARVTLVDTVTSLTGNTAQTGDAFARIGAPAGASVSADILEANADLDELITTVGAAGAGLTAIPGLDLTDVNADLDELITTVGAAGAGLTALGDTRIANLDTTVSSRSTFAGGAVASVTGAVGSVTGNVSGNVVGSVGSVSGAVGSVTGAVGSVTAAVSTNPNAVENAIKAKTDNLPTSPAAVGSVMSLDLTQAVPTSNTAQTIGDAMNAARAQGFGRWKLVGNTLSLYAADGLTVVKTLTFDDTVNPTERK